MRHGRPRRALLLVGAGLLAMVAGARWLLRDPVPEMLVRRGSLVAAETKSADSAGGHVDERVLVRGSTGLRTEFLLRRPARPPAVNADPAAARRHPTFLILGGYASQERAATLVENPGDNIIVAMAYPFDGDPKVKGFAVVPMVPRIRRAILDTPPAVMLVLDALRERGDVDTTRIELVGASFGAPFAAMTAALDARVSRLWLVHGAAWPYTLIEHNLASSISWRLPRMLVAALANLLADGPRLAPEHWVGKVSPRPVVMINAADDERLPHDAIVALHESARPPKEVIWLPGQHVQSNRRDVVQALVRTILERSAAAPPDSR